MSILARVGYGQPGDAGWLRNMAQGLEPRDRQPGAAFPPLGGVDPCLAA